MSRLQHFWHKIEGEALFRYNRLVSGTARWKIEGQENIDRAKASGRPLLWTYWHEHVTSFIMFGDRFEKAQNFSAIMVGDTRATILGRLGTRLGADMYGIDMKGNPVASGRMLLRVIQAMKKGKQTILAPDGPDGPAHEPKGGVAYIARKAEAAIIPIATYASPAYRMKRWDNHEVAFPFSKLTVFVGPPIIPDKKNTDDATLLQQITQALNDIHLKSKRFNQ